MEKKEIRVHFIWILLFVVVIFLFYHLVSSRNARHEEYATFVEHLENGNVEEVMVEGNQLAVSLRDGDHYITYGVAGDEFTKKLSEHGALLKWGQPNGFLVPVLTIVILLISLFAIVATISKKQKGGLQGIFALGKSRAQRITECSVTFEDVAGAVEAKEYFRDIIVFLKQHERWQSAGVRLPNGVLLVGPPGCGKTLMARAVAGEAEVPFFSVSASEFVEVFVGVGSARVRDTFDQARKEGPAILFIDELDALGRRRGSGLGLAHEEREQTLNQLLVCLDGFDSTDSVVVIAATNRPDVLDKALMRPGRFDLCIKIEPPTVEERLEALKIHTRNKTLESEASLESVAERTPGLTGADLETLTNDAALRSIRRVRSETDPKVSISMEDLEGARKSASPCERVFDRLDSILLESASQAAQPTGNVVVRVTTTDDKVYEGDLVWADGGFVKLRVAGEDDEGTVIPKIQMRSIEALDGTEKLHEGEAVGDQWGHKVTGAAL